MKKRFSEEQIIGLLGKAEAACPLKSYTVSTVSQKPATIYGSASLAA